MTLRSVLLPVVLLSCALTVPAQEPASLDAGRVSTLIAAASLPGLSPERQAARDELFRQVRPLLLEVGLPPSREDADALRRALASVPCVSGRPRLVKALVHGDLAYVAAAGDRGGGCSYLLRRTADGWAELLPIGWTLDA